MNYERRNFIAQRQICGKTKHFRRRWATRTRAIVATQGCSFLLLGARFGDGWHNDRRGLAVLSPRACSAQVWYLLLRVKPGCDHLSCGENVTFCAKKPLFYAARVCLSIAGFGPHRPGIGPTAASSDWYSARFVLRPRLGHAGRFSAPEVATCTNSCKKVFGKRLDYRCRLPATTWLMWG